MSNPVAYFTADNNGVIVELPAVSASGATFLTGTLIFGIGTESNNGLGTATVYALDPNLGVFTVTYKGNTLSNSFLDSGSNANYFVDATIPVLEFDSGTGVLLPAFHPFPVGDHHQRRERRGAIQRRQCG